MKATHEIKEMRRNQRNAKEPKEMQGHVIRVEKCEDIVQSNTNTKTKSKAQTHTEMKRCDRSAKGTRRNNIHTNN